MNDLEPKELTIRAKVYYDMRLELCKYHMLEQEIGIDLMTLFKVLKDGIYVNGEKEQVLLFYDMDFFNKTSFQLHASNGINYYFKDYGKTWTLTK